MELWHLLILGHVVLSPIGQYIGKLAVHRIHPYQILFYQYIGSLITVSILIKLLKPQSNFFDAPLWLVIIGVMYAFGISSMYHAKKQSLSKTSVVKKSADLITILLAVALLGEYQLLSLDTGDGIKRMLGIFLAMAMFVSFYYKDTHRGSEKTFNYKIWIKWITLTILIQGIAKFIVKYAVDLNEPLLVLRLQYIGSFTVIALLCFFYKKSIFVGWKKTVGCLLIGVFISTSLAALYTALSLSSATQVLPITAVSTIIILTLLGIFLFKERITKRMILPFVLGLISIYLLK